MLRTLRWLMFAVLLASPVGLLRGETVAGLPAPTGYVNDFAGVLTAETKQSLEDLCTQVDQKAHAQIAVVTIKTIDADKSGATPSIEEFATALEDKWKVGAKGTDRGVLMIFITSTTHGRIEVGYGLEGILNDAKVGDIGREMGPMLRAGNFDQAVPLGVNDVAGVIAADAGVSLNTGGGDVPAAQYQQPQLPFSRLQGLLLGGFVVVVLGVLIATGHIGMLFFILFNLLGGGGGRGEGMGGEGGGGGFGGFGGGGSGGGGANF